MLHSSLRQCFGNDYNLLPIDNSGNKYKSLATAYNENLEKYRNQLSDILIFAHPDIAFDDDIFEKKIIEELTNDPNLIIGFAGETEGPTLSNLKYRRSKNFIAIPFSEKTECLSIDECCFAMTKELFFKIKFDETACDNWHLYAADFCYDARRRYGTRTIVLPETIYHKEEAGKGLTVDINFLRTMWKLTKKYKGSYPRIKTTCYNCPTTGLRRYYLIGRSLFFLFTNKIKKIIC